MIRVSSDKEFDISNVEVTMCRKWAVCLGVVLAACGVARASDPVGVYAILDKVEAEPKLGPAERVRVTGTFALAKAGSRDDYLAPARGVIYFSLVKGKEDQCRKEWADLGRVAGTGQCVAFGSRYLKNATIRKRSDPTKDPDVYPLGVGVTKIPASTGISKSLLEASKGKP
jgi:hypothetical protein